MALVAMAVIILTASIGRRAKSTSAIQIKEPKLRPYTAAMPNVDHGGGGEHIYIYIHVFVCLSFFWGGASILRHAHKGSHWPSLVGNSAEHEVQGSSPGPLGNEPLTLSRTRLFSHPSKRKQINMSTKCAQTLQRAPAYCRDSRKKGRAPTSAKELKGNPM